jgi:hypothetical protein
MNLIKLKANVQGKTNRTTVDFLAQGFLLARLSLCLCGKSNAVAFLCALCAPDSAPSALNLPAFLFARLHQCLYQCSSAFISGDFDFASPQRDRSSRKVIHNPVP